MDAFLEPPRLLILELEAAALGAGEVAVDEASSARSDLRGLPLGRRARPTSVALLSAPLNVRSDTFLAELDLVRRPDVEVARDAGVESGCRG